MSSESEEHERTIAFGEFALGQIKALSQSASPCNYEIWYHYATGYNAALNESIDAKLLKNGSFSQDDAEQIHQQFFASTRAANRLETISGEVVGKITHVMSILDTAVGSTSKHSASLADMSDQLGHIEGETDIHTIIEGLFHTVKAMKEDNRALESRLSASKHEIAQLQQNLEIVRCESRIDALTTLGNRKCFDDALARAVAGAHERGEALSLIMTDIDHFKRFNDTYGHLTGDQVLRLVALAIKQNAKPQDIAARYGGEEFAIILPGTDKPAAIAAADAIRRTVMGKQLMKRSTKELLGRVTISAGVATLHAGDTAVSLIERTDRCLYAAKHNGRNQVVCETGSGMPPVEAMQVA